MAIHKDVTIADGSNYFGTTGLAAAVLRVRTDEAHSPSHPHDLTEIEHSHDFCELVIVSNGQAMHCLEGNDFPVTAGDIFLLQGHQRHYFYDRQNLHLINVMYDPQKIGLPENELRKLPGYCAMFLLEPTFRQQHRFASRLHLKRVHLAQVESIVQDMEQECTERPPGWEVAMRVKLMDLIVSLSRAYINTETTEAHALLRVGQVIGALENDSARDWTLEELVEMSHMSRSNLMRVFRLATGQPPIEYLIRLRIQKAMELLHNSNLTITEIAMHVGFNDSNYFSRQFRRVLKMSPRHYRNERRLP